MQQGKRVDGPAADGPARRTRARSHSDVDPPLGTVASARGALQPVRPPIRRSPVLFYSMTIFQLSQRHNKIILLLVLNKNVVPLNNNKTIQKVKICLPLKIKLK